MRATVQAARPRRGRANLAAKNVSNRGNSDTNVHGTSSFDTGEKMVSIGAAVQEIQGGAPASTPLPTHGVSADLGPPPSRETDAVTVEVTDVTVLVGTDPNINIATVGTPTNRYTDHSNINIATPNCCNIENSDQNYFGDVDAENAECCNIATNIDPPAKGTDEVSMEEPETGVFIADHRLERNSPRNPSPVQQTIASQGVLHLESSQVKKKNPKILILDFETPKREHLFLVHKTLHAKTNIRDFVPRQLERGGISILFRSAGARNHAEECLRKELSHLLKKPKPKFGDDKKFFEVIAFIPKTLLATDVQAALGAAKLIPRHGSRYVFCLTSREQANAVVESGYFFCDYVLSFKPFTFPARIACSTCGSFDHKLCEKKICLHCSGDHLVSSCPDRDNTPPKCLYCFGEHDARQCDQYVQRLKIANMNKRKSYAEVLKSGSSAPLPKGPKQATKKQAKEPSLKVSGQDLPMSAVLALLEAFMALFKITSANSADVIEQLKTSLKPSNYSKSILQKDVHQKRNQEMLYSDVNVLRSYKRSSRHHEESDHDDES
jgi:hypothetical protein